MDGYNIELGYTDGFRYVGIKPPPIPEHEAQVMRALSDISVNVGPVTQKPRRGEEYLEFGMSSTLYDHRQLEIAERVAEVLRSNDCRVWVNSEVKPLGGGSYLFVK